MVENTEIKENTEEETPSMAPYVNEKLKYWLIGLIVLLCIITAVAVVLTPEEREKGLQDRTTQSEMYLNT